MANQTFLRSRQCPVPGKLQESLVSFKQSLDLVHGLYPLLSITSSTNTENQSRLHLPCGDTRSIHVAMPRRLAREEHVLVRLITCTRSSEIALPLVILRGNPTEAHMLLMPGGSQLLL